MPDVVEAGARNVIWDMGLLIKRRIDPVRHAEMYFGRSVAWRVLITDYFYAQEIRPGGSTRKPHGVYPLWHYREDTKLLEEFVTKPFSQNPEVYESEEPTPENTPVPGQEHRVIIYNPPSAGDAAGKKFIAYLKELQEDYPECIIHYHGTYSYNVAFGMGWGAADIEPRSLAAQGKIALPTGKQVRWEVTKKYPKWVTAFGFKPTELEIPRNRTMYNITSALWAAENFLKLTNLPGYKAKKN